MGNVVRLLNTGLTADRQECERVSIEMGEAVCVAGKVAVLAEYEVVDGVYSVVLVVYKPNGEMVSRCGIGTGINLTPFGLPIIIFPKALTLDSTNRPLKVMVDVWVSNYYASKKSLAPLVETFTGGKP